MTGLEKDIEEAKGYARQALRKMVELGVLPTPKAYRLWFEAIRGEDAVLASDLDRLVAAGCQFTQATVEELYNRHFPGERNQELVSQAHTQLREVLRTILAELASSSETNSDFQEKLASYGSQLEGCSEAAEIERIVARLIKDTTEMARTSQGLRSRLEQTNAQARQLGDQLRRAESEAMVDFLTGLHNRRAFDRKIAQLLAAFQEDGKAFAVIGVDIDHFKQINDRFGHTVGDEVLRIVGRLLLSRLKVMDFPSRYGGEEFFVLLPETAVEDACTVADKVRAVFSEKEFKVASTGETVGRITASFGVAGVRPEDTVESVVERADQALYLAKNSGRDNVKSERDL